MLIEGLDAGAARSLAAVGVMGVRDLVAWTREPRRLRKLRQNLSQIPAALQAPIPVAELAGWGARPADLPRA